MGSGGVFECSSWTCVYHLVRCTGLYETGAKKCFRLEHVGRRRSRLSLKGGGHQPPSLFSDYFPAFAAVSLLCHRIFMHLFIQLSILTCLSSYLSSNLSTHLLVPHFPWLVHLDFSFETTAFFHPPTRVAYLLSSPFSLPFSFFLSFFVSRLIVSSRISLYQQSTS